MFRLRIEQKIFGEKNMFSWHQSKWLINSFNFLSHQIFCLFFFVLGSHRLTFIVFFHLPRPLLQQKFSSSSPAEVSLLLQQEFLLLRSLTRHETRHLKNWFTCSNHPSFDAWLAYFLRFFHFLVSNLDFPAKMYTWNFSSGWRALFHFRFVPVFCSWILIWSLPEKRMTQSSIKRSRKSMRVKDKTNEGQRKGLLHSFEERIEEVHEDERLRVQFEHHSVILFAGHIWIQICSSFPTFNILVKRLVTMKRVSNLFIRT